MEASTVCLKLAKSKFAVRLMDGRPNKLSKIKKAEAREISGLGRVCVFILARHFFRCHDCVHEGFAFVA